MTMCGAGRHAGAVDADEVMFAHYSRRLEADRLISPKGLLEFERTIEIIERVVPPPPAVVADVGGGPGRYSAWLAERGYRVEHRDRVALHVEQMSSAALQGVHTAVGDARALDLPDSSVDVVLLLGPLYHLIDRHDRTQALTEARRVVRPGGRVFVAAISRWAARLDGVLTERLYETRPNALEVITASESDGRLLPLAPGGFGGYTHRPSDLADEIHDAGLTLEDLVGVEGLPIASSELTGRLTDPAAHQVLLDSARAIERIPELLGLSSHLIATTRRPESSTGGTERRHRRTTRHVSVLLHPHDRRTAGRTG